jgi:hypothetical protein
MVCTLRGITMDRIEVEAKAFSSIECNIEPASKKTSQREEQFSKQFLPMTSTLAMI